MKKLLLLLFIGFLLSCDSDKTYKYIEHLKETNVDGKLVEKTEEEEIIAKNDTLAYIRAYSKFKISQRLAEFSLTSKSSYPNEVLSFELYDEKGNDITNIEFVTQESEKKETNEYVLKMHNPYEGVSNGNNNKRNYQSADINPCVMSEDFIKKDLRYPNTAKFSTFNCTSEQNSDGSYTVLRKVSAKNAFGVEADFIYKVRIGFTGGNEVDINNWKLIGIQSEEYR